MPAPAEIIQLVEQFRNNYDQYGTPAADRHDRPADRHAGV